MKKIKTSICVWLALSAVFMTGCYNDEDLWNIGDFVSVVIPDAYMFIYRIVKDKDEK